MMNAASSSGSSPADVERIARLETELSLFRASAGGSEALQSTIDNLAARKAALETENRSQALEVLALKQELKKMSAKVSPVV
jgi:hypothetical protein